MSVRSHGTKDYFQTLCKESLCNVQLIKEIGAKGGVATLALGSQPRQRSCKGAGQEEKSSGVKAKALQRCRPRGSWGVTSHTPRNVRKCEGVNTHTPKATPTLGDGVPVDSRNVREQFEGSKLNGL
jgi:hypothetical protein